MTPHLLRGLLLLAVVPLGVASGQWPDALRGAPLHYEAEATAGRVERLARALEAGEVVLEYDERSGYLPDLLAALEVPISSQTLVFSKTSFQDDWIGPTSPRAIYFGDDAYVGSVPHAPVLELTSMDPANGPTFYTLAQDPDRPPRLVRRHDECLQCHAGPNTRNWPGHIVRSVHPDRRGVPILRSGTELVNHTTPFAERWGGWYVTGTHGDARHLGNGVADPATERVDAEAGANVVELEGSFATERYLSPHSDLVALLVLEHQTEMHNRIARASYQVRLALERQRETNTLFGDPPDRLRDSTKSLLEGQARKLLEYLLFEDEALLPAPVAGTSAFTTEFQARGRRDAGGRSLRDLDLERRLFRYPCSYLIHSEAFDALPEELLDVLYRELDAVLAGEPSVADVTRLSDADRRAIREILLATKDGLPAGWGRADDAR